MIDSLGTVEKAIINRLSRDSAAGRWPFKAKQIVGYNGQFENEDDLRRAAETSPSFWVAFASETGQPEQSLSTLSFIVFTLVSNRSDEAVRHGDKAQPGLYAMIEAARLSLAGQTLGLLELTPLRLMSVRPVYRGGPQGLAIMALEFQTTLGNIRPDLDEQGDPCPDGQPLVQVVNWLVEPIQAPAAVDIIKEEQP